MGDLTSGTLFQRVKDAAQGFVAVGALLLGFQVRLGLVRSKYMPGGCMLLKPRMSLPPPLVRSGLPL